MSPFNPSQGVHPSQAGGGGPRSWRRVAGGLREATVTFTVERTAAWRRDVEPVLRAAVGTDPDAPADEIRQFGGCGAGARAFVMLQWPDVTDELYDWSPGFFDVFVATDPGDDAAVVRLRPHLLTAVGADAGLRLAEGYLADLGLRPTGVRPCSLVLAVDYVLDRAPDDRLFSARMPAGRRPLRRRPSDPGAESFDWDEAGGPLEVSVHRKAAGARLTRGGVAADVLNSADAARVWCVRFWANDTILRPLGVRTVEHALGGGAAAVWRWLATEAFTLRRPDGSVHGWWADVQAAADVFSAPPSLPRPADSPARPPSERPTPG